MPTLQELIAQALRARNVGATPVDPYARISQEFEEATAPPEIVQQLIDRLPEGAPRTAANFVAPSRLDIYTAGASKLGRAAATGLGLGKKALSDAILSVPVSQVTNKRNWSPVSRIFNRNVPDVQGQAPTDPRLLAGITEQTVNQAKGKTGARVRPFVAEMANDPYIAEGMLADAQAGVEQGGRSWYNPQPIEDLIGPDEMRKWSIIGAGASAQSPVNNELVSNAIIRHAIENGLSPMDAYTQFAETVYGVPRQLLKDIKTTEFLSDNPEEVRRAMAAVQELRTKYGFVSPTLSGMTIVPEGEAKRLVMAGEMAPKGQHFGNAQEGLAQGIILPSKLTEGSWKLPSYLAHRLGMDFPFPALDTHEKTRLWQLALDPKNPNRETYLKLLQEAYPNVTYRPKGKGGNIAVKGKDPIDLTESNDEYRLLSQIYTQGAERMGLPSAGAFQASRWIGGGPLTGLKSAPQGDLTQIFEDMVKYSALRRGMGTSRKDLQDYVKRVVMGQDFLVPTQYDVPPTTSQRIERLGLPPLRGR